MLYCKCRGEKASLFGKCLLPLQSVHFFMDLGGFECRKLVQSRWISFFVGKFFGLLIHLSQSDHNHISLSHSPSLESM